MLHLMNNILRLPLMRTLTAACLCLGVLTSCGGGGGGGSDGESAPIITFDSISPASFTPPATTTANFTVTVGSPSGVALGVYATTGNPNALQFRGEVDTNRTSTGTFSHQWDGYTAYWQAGATSVALPMFLQASSTTSTATYRVYVQRQPMKTNGV